MGEALPLEFVGANKDTVRGLVVKPVDFDPGKKYPVAFLIHGGPQGSFGNRWNFRWNPQTYAGAGYAVVMIDFHGSTGYGQAFTDAIQDDWGGKPLQDLKLGLAAALTQQDWLDPTRVCALGASYGGFMVNWIASQWPEAFQCLVNHDGVFDNRMMYYATEELWFPEWEHKGPYWEQQARHELHNPVNHVDQWRLPMLVIHGALDYRIPDSQGLAAFTANILTAFAPPAPPPAPRTASAPPAPASPWIHNQAIFWTTVSVLQGHEYAPEPEPPTLLG